MERDMNSVLEDYNNKTQKMELNRIIFPCFISLTSFLSLKKKKKKQLLKETKIILSNNLLQILCLKCSRSKHNWFPFGKFGFCSTGKEKDESQQEGEREEETTKP